MKVAADTRVSADATVAEALEQPESKVTLDSGFNTNPDISELQFRARFLERLEGDMDAAVPTVDAASDCSDQKEAVDNALETAYQVIGNIERQEVSGILESAQKLLANTKSIVEEAFLSATETTDIINEASPESGKNKVEERKQLGIALVAFNQMLGSLARPDNGVYSETLTTLTESLSSVQEQVQKLFHCLASSTRLLLEDSHCGMLADFYRTSVEGAIKTNQELAPRTPPKETKDQDLTRLMAGLQTLLELMSKTSISSSNEGLLSIRPIFAADVLDQFRDQLYRAGEEDNIKSFARFGLGQVIGASNALEACLRIAADPVVAIDELNEELDFQDQQVFDGDEFSDSEDDGEGLDTAHGN
ncbi:hypothetical protein BGW38_000385 [Lunasporangiospora selenospora]|uniref:Uncharacterized protein n=1 Tax=Lunasporangiospora selenospora TaxID=979761 RepID=A0A9P6FV70_9FUNG|nr:hypothetical protein BGW38_000385 [Lunasporangiospora selenospora]